MGIFGGDKPDPAVLLAENGGLLREIEMLREQLGERKEELGTMREQLRWTQDALIAKEAPEAYRDRQDVEANAQLPAPAAEVSAEATKRNQEAEIKRRYISSLEDRLFEDADDMQAKLMGAVGVPLSEPQSLHGNDES
jgi:hypothetical protein